MKSSASSRLATVYAPIPLLVIDVLWLVLVDILDQRACACKLEPAPRLWEARRIDWSLSGTYFESCNCDAICPCRRIDGTPGGRSTHGVCLGVLSWVIHEGTADGVNLAGLPVAVATRYSDDEPGSPWTWILYLDERA